MIKHLIDRPIAVTMSVIAVMVLGIVSINYLPISLMPDIDIPQMTVQVSDPGASVREINASLKPLKNQLTQVVGLQSITSEAKSDAGTIFMTFDPGSNIDMIFIEVNEKIDRSMSSNEDMERPKVMKASATDIPAFYLNLTLRDGEKPRDGKLPEAGSEFSQLSIFANDVVLKRIEQQKEVAMVDISGVVTSELLCIPDYDKLTSMGEDVDLLENAITSNNVQLGALSIKDGVNRYNIHFDSTIQTKEDIENIYINHNGRVYKFDELCEVVERTAKRNGLVRSDGENAVTMAIIKQSDAKMEALQKSIDLLLKDLRKEYPEVKFDLTRDQTQLLTYSINNLKNNLLMGSLLACFIIFFFMKDFRSPLLIIITIPLALIVTMLAFHAFGITLNIISLSGLVLGVGMMVDNSIIVIDNIMQRWEEGFELKEAIAKAVGEVFTPMLSSVLTTCSVFLPLIFLSGVAGALFYDQAMAVTIALFSSLFVSVLAIPVYFFQLYKGKGVRTENAFMAKVSNINYYAPYEFAMKAVLRHRGLSFIFFLLTIPSIYFVYTRIEKSSLPYIHHNDAIMTIDWNMGISLDENDRRVGELLYAVRDDLDHSTAMVGAQQFLLSHTKDITASESIVYIRAANDEVLAKVQRDIERYMMSNYPKGVVEFEVAGNIFDMIFSSNAAPLVAELQRRDGKAITVEDVEVMVDKIQDRLPDTYITPVVKEQIIRYIANTREMSRYGIEFRAIQNKLKNVVSQNDLFSINQGGYSVPVTTGDDRAQSEDILSNKVRSNTRVEVPLNLLITESKGEDFKRLYSGKAGDYYPIEIYAEDREVVDIMEAITAVTREDGDFFVRYSGEYFNSKQMVEELIIVLIIAISLLYFILAAQFESLIQPLIILSEVVFDLFWVMFILWCMGESLNLMSLIGIVVMSGIIINDSILKVDTINRLRRSGMSLIKAVFVGGHSRLKPILMTSLTTILALVPFLSRTDMGSDLQYPLSVSVIVGMLVGTIVSLLFIPLAYYTIYKNSKVQRDE
ncbi:MAG: efflux RND transporter permease subunit [Rikenellaceae bacterium]